MRLAGAGQHAQILAHALDSQHGAIVDGGELAWRSLCLDLDDVWPRVFDIDGHLDLLADAYASRGGCLALMGNRQLHGRCARIRRVDDLDLDVLRAAENAEARRAQDQKTEINLVRHDGWERMHRGI